MKHLKWICGWMSVCLLASLLVLSVAAFADVQVDFEELPAGLDNVEGVSVASNKSLLVSLPGKAGDDGVATEWGYKGWISISDTPITTDSTVTFYFMIENYPDRFCHMFPMLLSDAIGKTSEGQHLGGVCSNNNISDNKKAVLVSYTADTTAKLVETDVDIPAGVWVRFDYLVDFTAKKTTVYMNCSELGTCDWTPDAVGFSGFKSCTLSSGNYRMNFYVDELVVRNGLTVPAADDICGVADANVLASDASVVKYDPFDSKNAKTISNTNWASFSIQQTGGFNRSTLELKVPHAATAFEAYIPLSATPLGGNATVSFKIKTEYTVKNLPGLRVKLADSDRAPLGGFVVNRDATLAWDNGENVWPVAKNGSSVVLKSGEWYYVELLVNYSNRSLTLYLNGDRLGTVALESTDLQGFCGVQLEKYSDTGAKAQNFSFDDLVAVSGLYPSGAISELAQDDPAVTIDVAYEAETGTDSQTPSDQTTAPTAATEAPATGEAPAASAESGSTAKSKGCGSVIGIGSASALVLLLGGAIAIRKKD